MRCTPYPVRVGGAGEDQGFSLMGFTDLPDQVSPQPLASGLRSVWEEE